MNDFLICVKAPHTIEDKLDSRTCIPLEFRFKHENSQNYQVCYNLYNLKKEDGYTFWPKGINFEP